MTAVWLFTGHESGAGKEITILVPVESGGHLLRCAGHTAWPTLQDPFSFLPVPPFYCLSPSFLPVFVPLSLACSLKLACGTQGQTDYSFSSMNVPFN